MGKPARAIATKKGRFYLDPRDDKTLHLSVTNVLDTAIGKPALIAWAARTVAEEAINGLPRWNKLARHDPDAAIKELKGTPYASRDKAAAKGSRVHDIAESIALGHVVGELEDEVAGYVTQYLAWREDFRPAFHASEATVINRTHGYAGTLDAIVEINGERLLIDYKTGKGIYPEVALQLTAYRHGDVVLLPDRSETTLPQVDGLAVLHLQADGYSFRRIVADDATTFAAFLAALTVARWLQAADDTSPLSERLIPSRAATDAAPIPMAV